MSKSKSRYTVECENCFLCDKITKIHEHNDISELLANVKKWDDQCIENQFKYIQKFECLVCFFKTSIFNDWKCHIMSVTHLADSHTTRNLYSYVCSGVKCKMLMYGPKKSLLEHSKDEHSENKSNVDSISLLMAEVMNRFINKLKPLHYCSHCKKFADTPIHTKGEQVSSLKQRVEYYCKFCRVSFISSPEMIDYHSLSVEHMTLKCFDELCSKAKLNSKRKKLSEPSIQNEENILLPAIQNVCATTTATSINLPVVVLNRFQNISQCSGECKLCTATVSWDNKEIYSHLLNCPYKFDLTGANKTTMTIFTCKVCDYSVINDMTKHKLHIISVKHLTNCLDTNNYYSYFCNVCNLFMYSDKDAIKRHWELNHKSTITTGFPMLSKFMANIFKDFNKNPNRAEIIHYYEGNGSIASSKVSFLCSVCKVEFHTNIMDYYMHEITSEHIILKFLSPNVFGKKKINLPKTRTRRNKKKQTAIQNLQLVQKCDTKVTDSEQLQNIWVNKSQRNVDVNHAELMDNIKKTQNLFKTVLCLEESDGHVQNGIAESIRNIDIKLTQSHCKQRYTKYFKHKMNLLNLLQQYRHRIIKTMPYYCDECDFIAEEKYVWDNHNKMEHPKDVNRHIIYCYTCSVMIVGGNETEHNRTQEHQIFLKYLQSLEHTENDLMKKIMPVKSVELFIDTERNKELMLNSTGVAEGTPVYHCSNNNGCKNSDCLLEKEHNENGKVPIITNTFLSLDKNNDENINKHDNDEASVPNPVKLINGESTSLLNNSLDTSLTTPYTPDVEAKLFAKKNCVDVSTSIDDLDFSKSVFNLDTNKTLSQDIVDNHKIASVVSNTNLSFSPPLTNDTELLENEKTGEPDEDKAYGEYVSQRLKMIENAIVKQNVKLEIDYIFYTQLKQLSLEKTNFN